MLKQSATALGQLVATYRLIVDATGNSVTSDPELVSPQNAYRAFQAHVTGSGASASVDIEVSTNGTDWMKALTLTPKLGADDGCADLSPWPYVRAVVTRNNGTLNVTMGC